MDWSIFNEVWGTSLTIFGGATVGAVVVAIGAIFLRALSNRIVGKVNVQEIVDKSVDAGTEKIKVVSFKQNIEPLVKSELRKVTEASNEKAQDLYAEVIANQQLTIDILEKFASYFDDSITVTDEKRAELKEAIAKAKKMPVEAQEIVVEYSTAKKEETPKKSEKPSYTTVER